MKDPYSVSKEWREYFEERNQEKAASSTYYPPPTQAPVQGADQLTNVLSQLLGAASSGGFGSTQNATEVTRLLNLYRSYQTVGHEKAKIDPLKLLETYGNVLEFGKRKKTNVKRLDFRFHGFTDQQLDNEIFVGKSHLLIF